MRLTTDRYSPNRPPYYSKVIPVLIPDLSIQIVLHLNINIILVLIRKQVQSGRSIIMKDRELGCCRFTCKIRQYLVV
ncbi:MAG: hypothetical protein C00003105_01570 [ANME-2 cluster archaeon HR1]|nr:MAG: hypothetical protein C00003105_01570 [ANME-2 cluster archaeon HR1]